jgi:hypothetical protein
MVTHVLLFFIGALSDTNSTGDGVWELALWLSTDREKTAPFLPTQIHKMTDPTTQQRSYPSRQASSYVSSTPTIAQLIYLIHKSSPEVIV